MKKFLATILFAAMTLMILASCGGSIPANTVFSADDLAGKKIGVQLGTVGDLFASDYEADGAVVERYNKGADAVQALKQGKVDAVIIDEQPAKVFVQNNPELKILDNQFDPEEYAIAVAKENTDLLEKINAALVTLNENGTMELITKNYIGEEKGKHPYVSPEGVDRSNGTLIMATNAEFEPYEFRENNEIVGFDVDMARAIADLLGMELQIDDMLFDSIINAVVSGKADVGIAGMTVRPDRLENVNFSTPYTTSQQVIIVRGE